MNNKPNFLILLFERTTDNFGSRFLIETATYFGHLSGAMRLAESLVEKHPGEECVWQIADIGTVQVQLQNF